VPSGGQSGAEAKQAGLETEMTRKGASPASKKPRYITEAKLKSRRSCQATLEEEEKKGKFTLPPRRGSTYLEPKRQFDPRRSVRRGGHERRGIPLGRRAA